MRRGFDHMKSPIIFLDPSGAEESREGAARANEEFLKVRGEVGGGSLNRSKLSSVKDILPRLFA